MGFRLFCAAAVLLACSCTSKKPIVVGSKEGAEQRILAEIVAQHLEKTLDRTVERRMELGDTRVTYQALLDGEIGMYPEYSGLIVTEILKKPANPDPSVVYEFARLEMRRISLLDYLDLLGFDNRSTFVVRASGNEQIRTASEAATAPVKWKLGMPAEYQQRETTLPQLSQYPFSLGAPMRGVRTQELFALMEEDKLNLVVTTLTDSHLTSPAWKALEDDRKVFPAAEAALLVRQDIIAENPELRPALAELKAKISLEAMRKMNAAVEIDERKVEDVVADFLKSAGLR